MTILTYDLAESVQTTTSTSLVQMRQKGFTLDQDGKDYFLLISCEFTIDNKNDRAELQIRLDGTPCDDDSFSPITNSSEAHKFMSQIIATQDSAFPLNSGAHTLTILARSINGNTVSVRRVRLRIDKR